jgi:hypothetical protein
MGKRLALLCAIVLTSSRLATAAPIVIDFEGLTDGQAVTNQLPGILFSHAIALTAGLSLNEFEAPPHSGTTVIGDDGGVLTIQFASEVTSVAGYFTYVSPLTLEAFDAANNLLGSVVSHFGNNLALSGDPGSVANDLLLFNSPGIARIVITGLPDGNSFVLDDLTIAAPAANVPEPASIILVLTGLGALLAHRRRA